MGGPKLMFGTRMAVHNIQMKKIRAADQNLLDFSVELGEIRGKDRAGEFAAEVVVKGLMVMRVPGSRAEPAFLKASTK